MIKSCKTHFLIQTIRSSILQLATRRSLVRIQDRQNLNLFLCLNQASNQKMVLINIDQQPKRHLMFKFDFTCLGFEPGTYQLQVPKWKLDRAVDIRRFGGHLRRCGYSGNLWKGYRVALGLAGYEDTRRGYAIQHGKERWASLHNLTLLFLRVCLEALVFQKASVGGKRESQNYSLYRELESKRIKEREESQGIK